MKRKQLIGIFLIATACLVSCNNATSKASPHLIPHSKIQEFKNNGNSIRGIATALLGASNHEVWRTSVKVGGKTPKHTHESEEILVFLKGQGKAIIGKKIIPFSAPCTLIAPAGVPHHYQNTGNEPTDAIVVVGIGSKIVNHEHKEMQLPWR